MFAGALSALAGAAAPALAGGSPENVLLIINPADPDSMYLGNYYKHARGIPDRNVMYIDPASSHFTQFAGPNGNIDALFGHLFNADIERTIHYIVIAPGETFFVPAWGYVTDSCSPVDRFSISSAFTLAHVRSLILGGNVPSTIANGYASISTTVYPAFDSTTTWAGGVANAAGQRFYIASLLGYTGEHGQTVAEIRELIDRNVAADGLRPAGTFYFMNNASDPARNVRANTFNGVASALNATGASAQVLNGSLPIGQHDILGVMTGAAQLPILTAEMTILPVAFADHMTSYAGVLNGTGQTTLIPWLQRGAIASSGTVDEPCNYPGKFPHAILHFYSFRGMSIGESWFRSMAFMPFQHILVGDPLTRPFAIFPTVQPNVPTGVLSGQVMIEPDAETAAPGVWIHSLAMFVNGVRVQTRLPSFPFTLDTTTLPDGYNEVRFVAYDSTQVRTAGTAVRTIQVNNSGLSAQISPSALTGDLSTRFTFDVSASGAAVQELRLLHNGRVIAAANASPAVLHTHGQNLGGGPSRVQLEAVFAGGGRALSAPVNLDVTYEPGTPAGPLPVAYGYTLRVRRDAPFVVHLPGSFDDDPAEATYQILTLPSRATSSTGQGAYRIMTPNANAAGSDPISFRITTPSGQSNIATIVIQYGVGADCYANCDGSTVHPILNIDDFTCFINDFAAAGALPYAQQLTHYANCDASTTAPVLNIDDFTCFINQFAQGCN